VEQFLKSGISYHCKEHLPLEISSWLNRLVLKPQQKNLLSLRFCLKTFLIIFLFFVNFDLGVQTVTLAEAYHWSEVASWISQM